MDGEYPKFFWFATTVFYDPLSIDPLRGVIKKGGGGDQPFVAVDLTEAQQLVQLCKDLHSIHDTVKYYVYNVRWNGDEPLLVKEIG